MEDSINILKPSVCFEVQKVIGISKNEGNCRSYQVQWAPSWISGKHLIGCEDLIKQFEGEEINKELNLKIKEEDISDEQEDEVTEEKISEDENQDENLDENQTQHSVEGHNIQITTDVKELQFHCNHDDNKASEINMPYSSAIIPEAIGLLENIRKPGESTVLSFQSNISLNNKEDTQHKDDSSSVVATFIIHNSKDYIGKVDDTQLPVTVQSSSRGPTKRNVYEIENKDCEKLVKKSKCEKMFKCNVCSDTFSSNDGLSSHFKLHTTYICHVCGVSFTSKLYLEKHVQIHTQEKDGDSSLADDTKNEDVTSKIQNSLRKGEGDRFHCDFCGRFFDTSRDMERHLLEHTMERPFECCICHKRFIRNHSMRKHMRTVHSSSEYAT